MRQTLKRLCESGAKKLEEAGVREAELDAGYLLLHVFRMDMAHYLLDREKPLPDDGVREEQIRRYGEMIRLRASRTPIQQLCGVQEFMGLRFQVNPHVLIPRQDTETLVELILNEQKSRGQKVLDLCTGSGCIAVSLKKLGGYREVTGTDISEKALETARANAEENGVAVRWIRSDMFQKLDPETEKFDILVSNPPYIPTEVIHRLEPEVRDHEPVLALDGHEDGLHFYRVLAKESGRYLRARGSIYLEIGFDQAREVTGLLSAAGFSDIQVIKDAPGLDRVIRAVL